MAFFDLSLEQLRTYQSPESEPADFDVFWQDTLTQTREHPLAAQFVPVQDSIYQNIEVFDVTFAGFEGQPVKGWLVLPRFSDLASKNGKLPCMVTYLGYSGGRSFPHDHLQYAMAGMAQLVMDTRGQGWSSPGHTPDSGNTPPAVPGVMTRGIESRETYYYRRLFTDAVRAVEAAQTHPKLDPQRLGVAGGSQGGGITLAVAGLCAEQVKVAMPDVPFLCHYRRATAIVDSQPYGELVAYLKNYRGRCEAVFKVLSYFDGVNFAARIRAKSLFSVGLMDTICPPSTVFAAYNRVPGFKDIKVYDFNHHEGGGSYQAYERLCFARQHLA